MSTSPFPDMITASNGVRYPGHINPEATRIRDSHIIRLRHQGMSMRTIAANVGCSVYTVHRVIHREIDAHQAAQKEEAL